MYLDGVLEDYWTPELAADNLTITLTTDYSINAWGFRADLVSYYEQLPFGMCNRNEDCGTALDCIPNFCDNHYAPCYGECRHDDSCDDGTLDLSIGHSYAGDLVVGLTNPAGQRTLLWNREGGGQQNVALQGFELTAEQSLSLTDAQGTWTLDVSDHASLDTGTLETWSLHFSCH